MSTFVQKSTELFADNASSIAPSLAGVTANNLVVLGVAFSATVTTPAISAPSGWLTATNPTGINAPDQSFNPGSAIFYKEGASAGTQSATVTLPAAGSYAAASIVESSGAKTSGALAQANFATGTGTSGGTGNATNGAANAFVFVVGHAEDGVGSTASFSSPASTGYSGVDTEPSNSTHIAYDISYKLVSAIAAQSASWTWTTSSGFVNTIAVFDDAPAGPTITAQPASTNVVVGQTAAFSVKATGATSYQWQDNSSGSFADIGGATSSTYTTAATDSSFQRRQYRCVVTNASGSVNTSTASLTLTFNDVYLYSMPEFADPDDVDLRDPTVFTAGGGGTTYNDSVAETLAGVDTITATAAFAAVIAETGAATDTVTAAAVFAATVAETANAVDTVAAAAITAAAISETGSAADTVTATATLNAVIAETLTAVDTPDALLTFIAQVSEVLSGVDTVTASALFNAAVAETLAAVDTVTASALFNAVISETLSAVDTTDATITGAGGTTYNDSVAETLNAVDTVSASALYAGAVAEALSAADSIDALLTQLGVIAETLAATETVNGLITATAAVSETGAASDTVTSLLVTTASIQEVVNAVETITTQTNFNASITEVMNATDSTDATGGSAPVSSGHAYWVIFKRRTRR